MSAVAKALNIKIEAELHRQLDTLRRMTRDQLLALPESSTELVDIDAHQVSFTTYCDLLPDGRLLVAVRSDRPQLLGLVSMGTTDAFLVLHSGENTDAPEELLWEF